MELQGHDDLEIQEKAKLVASAYSAFPHPQQIVDRSVCNLFAMLNQPDDLINWRSKVRILPILQVLCFRHLSLLSIETEVKLMDSIFNLLSHTQVEIRNSSAETLTGMIIITLIGLIQCSQRNSINGLLTKFICIMKETSNSVKQHKNKSQNELFVKRHASILGLSSLILAFPYIVHSWMPQVLVLLASCVGEPSPISV